MQSDEIKSKNRKRLSWEAAVLGVKHIGGGGKTNNSKLYSFTPFFFWSTDLLVKISGKRSMIVLMTMSVRKPLNSYLVYTTCFVILHALAFKLLCTGVLISP